jgi:uncharacterized membrane protein
MRLALAPCALLLLAAAPSLAQEHDAVGVAEPPDWLDAHVNVIVQAIEIAGIAVIVLGGLIATFWFLRELWRTRAPEPSFHAYRGNLGRGILLGLEFLVAADIIGTVAIDPTLQSLAVLAGIVLIRTFLSFSLDVEIEGHWPWRRSTVSAPPDRANRADQSG